MNQHRAFSLIELSMVLVLLTAIILGVMNTTSLIGDSTLSKAKILTKQSPVKDISGLILWVETSLEESFVLSEIEDGQPISTWHDIKNNALKSNHPNQSTTLNQPTYQEKAFNKSIPGIRFDGINDYLNFDGDGIINSSYTIFVVEKRTSNKDDNYFISGTGTTSNENLILGYDEDTSITHSHYLNNLTHAISGYSNNIERIHSFTFDMSGKKYYLNGGSSSDENDLVTNTVEKFDGATIGEYLGGTTYYQGDIAEIIIFNKTLKNEDRSAVEEYLGKKYDITLN